MSEYVYEVRSDVPLALVSGAGNVPVLTPVASGVIVGREFRTVRSGPQGWPDATVRARLVQDGSEVAREGMDRAALFEKGAHRG